MTVLRLNPHSSVLPESAEATPVLAGRAGHDDRPGGEAGPRGVGLSREATVALRPTADAFLPGVQGQRQAPGHTAAVARQRRGGGVRAILEGRRLRGHEAPVLFAALQAHRGQRRFRPWRRIQFA